jgi:hypothetical protein
MNHTNRTTKKRPKQQAKYSYPFLIGVTIMATIMVAIIRIYIHEQDSYTTTHENINLVITSLEEFKRKNDNTNTNDEKTKNIQSSPLSPPEHQYHTLDCTAYGGPSNEEAQEMVYWQGMHSFCLLFGIGFRSLL